MVFRIKQILLRLFGATLLVATGYAAFHTAKTWPRCVITHDKHILHFSDDGRTIVTGYTGVHIGPVQNMGEYKLPLQVWDTHDGTVVKTVMQDAALAKNCTFSADRRYSMADLDQGTLLLVDWQTGAETRISIDHPHDIRGFYFSPSADLFYLYLPGSKQPHVLIDVAKCEVAVRLFADDFPAVRFSGDGSRLYLLTERGVAAWNTRTRRIEGAFEGSEAVQFDRQEKRVATGIGKRTLVIWDTVTFQPIGRIDDTKIDLHYHNVSMSPSGKLVAMFPHAGLPTKVKNDLSARVWETDTGRLVATVPLERPVWAWLDDDKQWRLFDEQEFKLVDIATSTVLWRKPAQLGRLFFFNQDFGLHANPQGTWDFFDPATGEVKVQLPFPFDPKASQIASANDWGAVCTFGRRTEPSLPPWLDKWIGRYLGPSDGEVQVLDRAARRIVFQMHTSADEGAVVSKDGKTLLIYDRPRDGGGAAAAATPSYRFRFYDMYTWRPWFWALGIPVALFAIFLMWRRWSGR